MLLAGDEFGESQEGNNNAYCQDNDLTWLHWDWSDEQRGLLDFVRQLIQLRKDQSVFRRRRFFQGRPIRGERVKDIYWFTPAGTEMTDADWQAGFVRCLGVGLVGDQLDETDSRGEPVRGDTFLLLFNAHHEPMSFQLTGRAGNLAWDVLLDTGRADAARESLAMNAGYHLEARSLAVLQLDTERTLQLRSPAASGGSSTPPG
jgi:glycogen operon protein